MVDEAVVVVVVVPGRGDREESRGGMLAGRPAK